MQDQDFTDIIADYDVVFDMPGGEAMRKPFKAPK